jgi:DNA-binding response OmpR family regulator
VSLRYPGSKPTPITFVLDLGLPKKSGATVLGEIRMRNLQVPVRVITACGAFDDASRDLTTELLLHIEALRDV